MNEVIKQRLTGLVEPGIYAQLPPKVIVRKKVNPRSLVTWNRLDIGMRTLYLQLKDRVPFIAEKIYYEDLKAQSLGTMIDPDNPAKNHLQIFKRVFDKVSKSVADDGFDSQVTLLPLAATGSILNGGHRLSAALIHGKEVACIETGLPPITCDYKYFFDRAVPVTIIEHAVVQLVEFASNCFVACFFSSGTIDFSLAEELFQNVIYKKKLNITNKGALNLLYQYHNYVDSIGDENLGSFGLNQKLVECFPNRSDALMIVFQAEGGLDQVLLIKEKIREINGFGLNYFYITNTQEESLRLVRLLCNENGMHYLNYAQLINNKNRKILCQIKDLSEKTGIDTDGYIIDGSWLLELYGLRKADDIDILAASSCSNAYASLGFDVREKEILHHGKSADELVYDPANYFYLFGVKLVGFNQLHTMKRNRGEAKDLLDIKLMFAISENNGWLQFRTRLEQRLLYMRIRGRNFAVKHGRWILKKFGLYKPVRAIYLFVKGRKKV